MNLDTADIEQPKKLVNDLQHLLEKQIECTKKSDFRGAETLSEQTDRLVNEIVKIRLSEQPQLKGPVGQLIQLYKKLELMIAAEKESTRRQLRKAGNGKRTIQAYH